MVSCFNHLLQLTLSSEQILSQVQGTRKQSISLLAACFLPFKRSPETGDSEPNGYWSYTRPFSPTQNTGKSGLSTRLARSVVLSGELLQSEQCSVLAWCVK